MVFSGAGELTERPAAEKIIYPPTTGNILPSRGKNRTAYLTWEKYDDIFHGNLTMAEKYDH